MGNSFNPDSPIAGFSLSDMIDMTGTPCCGLMRECIVARTASHAPLQLFTQPCHINALILGVGLEGETDISLNLRDFRVRKDTLFVVAPQTIVQMRSADGFRSHVLVISEEFMRRMNLDTKRIIPIFMQYGAHTCLDLAPEEVRSVRSFISLVDAELHERESAFSRDVLGGLISAVIYKTGEIMSRYLVRHPEAEVRLHSRGEEYFRRFIELLGQYYRQERSVGFYARQLCITPKYLTTLIKRISGRSVSDWIDIYVVMEAKTLLRYSNRSIQEVAYCLNFPNQSFFGSYFKRLTGLSPSEYKAQK